jgi:tRNA A37 threonylcarbamoyladenosine dehydratase
VGVMEQFQRLEMLIGEDNVAKLDKCRVAVFGIGGVGGYVVEALARSGISHFDLIDNDYITTSNINRQILALHSTIGRRKTEVAKERVLDINPNATIDCYNTFFLPENSYEIDFSNIDYIVDAIDTVTSKIELCLIAKNKNIPIISSMGTGNKLDPTLFEIADIKNTSVCPLARVMRRELSSRGVEHLKVVYSKEKPISSERKVPASCAFVPSVAGLIIAGEVIKDLIK